MKNLNYEDILSRSKIFDHPERLGVWHDKGISKPITVEIDPTNKCNYNCKGCAGNRSSPQAELSYENMKKIIDEVSRFIKGIVFTGGGEPLINPHATEAITYARNKGIDVGLVTNGSLLNSLNLEALVRNCTWIRVSIDAVDKQMYAMRKGTREDCYEFVWDNVSKSVITRNTFDSNCTIGVAYLTDDNDNYRNLESFAKQANQIGTDYAEFHPYHNSNTNFIILINKTRYLATDSFKIIYPSEKYERIRYDYEQAFADEFRFVVAATGDVYPDCFTRGIRNFAYGNLLEQTFEEIWRSQKREEILRTKLQQKNCQKQCHQDTLNQLLWSMYISKKESKHVNFI